MLIAIQSLKIEPTIGLPLWLKGWRICLQEQETQAMWVRFLGQKVLWEGNVNPLQHSCLWNSMDFTESLVGYSPTGPNELTWLEYTQHKYNQDKMSNIIKSMLQNASKDPNSSQCLLTIRKQPHYITHIRSLFKNLAGILYRSMCFQNIYTESPSLKGISINPLQLISVLSTENKY